MVEGVCLAAYIIMGIGYTKTLTSLIKENDFGMCVLSLVFWPLWLVVASFWNFKDD
ncbi:hypothetical protein FDI23_gp079 [Serratia phage CHI14]|uniref:Uncharacterized protein n=2 Tax=Winklervirus chi14 TaxID=2560752 RepID=A0A1Z1LY85_9CAUD|nr:hypothetical protein FDI23_gp079 [Serratia phage CHI14]ARW57502.1 hypothetical protein [Serratia phage CHI14]ARW57777.1 hypothetical protein [Serratia phage CBH8]UJJ22065.1 hypothetical protein [Erwinia phage Virsaitis27]UYM28728.1 hypothetical protein [Serratia phage vB_SspM_LC53]